MLSVFHWWASVMFSILIWALVTLGILIVVLLLVPLELRAEGRIAEDALDGELRVGWGLGLLGIRLSSRRPSGITLCGGRVAGLPRRVKPGEKEPPKERRKSRRGTRWALQHRAGLQRALRRLGATLGLRLELSGRIGLGDPADTAVAAFILDVLERWMPGLHIDLGWDFLDEVLEVDGRGRARIWPVHLLGVGLALLLDGEVRSLLRAPAKAA